MCLVGFFIQVGHTSLGHRLNCEAMCIFSHTGLLMKKNYTGTTQESVFLLLTKPSPCGRNRPGFVVPNSAMLSCKILQFLVETRLCTLSVLLSTSHLALSRTSLTVKTPEDRINQACVFLRVTLKPISDLKSVPFLS